VRKQRSQRRDQLIPTRLKLIARPVGLESAFE